MKENGKIIPVMRKHMTLGKKKKSSLVGEFEKFDRNKGWG